MSEHRLGYAACSCTLGPGTNTACLVHGPKPAPRPSRLDPKIHIVVVWWGWIILAAFFLGVLCGAALAVAIGVLAR